MAGTVADRAVSDAAAHTRKELVDWFSGHGPRALQRLRQAEATLVVPWPASGVVITLGEALRIVILEARWRSPAKARSVVTITSQPASRATAACNRSAVPRPGVSVSSAARRCSGVTLSRTGNSSRAIKAVPFGSGGRPRYSRCHTSSITRTDVAAGSRPSATHDMISVQAARCGASYRV